MAPCGQHTEQEQHQKHDQNRRNRNHFSSPSRKSVEQKEPCYAGKWESPGMCIWDGSLPSIKNTCTVVPVVNMCVTLPVPGSTSAAASRTFRPVILSISLRKDSTEFRNSCW